MKKRIVITGMATINPLGDTLEEYYNNLIAGKSGIKRWESLDLSKVENKVGGDMGDYDTKTALEKFKDDVPEKEFKHLKKLFRTATFSSKVGSLTAMGAWKDAGLLGTENFDPYNTMVVVAGNNFNNNYLYTVHNQYLDEPEFIDPLASVEGIDNNIPAMVTEVLHVHGPAYTVGGACASGNLALRDAVRDIRAGECERAVVCGAPFDVGAVDIQASVILSSVVVKPELQEDPTKACRPFDTQRSGFLYSHGAATIIVEDYEVAKARGAKIYAEVLSVKASANGNHLPMPGADHQAWAMQKVLDDAGVKPEEILYANCHATGTPAGDLQEVKAMKKVFGDHIKNMKINAPKSMLGHTCWASPIVETIGGIMQMNNSKLHPTINVDDQDPEIDIDVCKDGPVDWEFDYMLKNSFGFGGLNCVSLIKKYKGD